MLFYFDSLSWLGDDFSFDGSLFSRIVGIDFILRMVRFLFLRVQRNLLWSFDRRDIISMFMAGTIEGFDG